MPAHLRLHALLALCALGLACAPQPTRIAVVPFGLARGTAPPPVDVAEVIRAALAERVRYAPLAFADLPSRPTRLADVRFEDWRHAGADYVVIGVVAGVHDGGHEVEFRLLDTRAQAAVLAFMVPSAPEALVQTALEIAARIDRQVANP